jgi:hypothetical protein
MTIRPCWRYAIEMKSGILLFSRLAGNLQGAGRILAFYYYILDPIRHSLEQVWASGQIVSFITGTTPSEYW